jgi:hypothetical protein
VTWLDDANELSEAEGDKRETRRQTIRKCIRIQEMGVEMMGLE